MAEALTLMINENIEDPNLELPRINAITFSFKRQGNGTSMCTFKVSVKKEIYIRVAGGKLYDDKNTELPNNYLLKVGVNSLKIKAINEKGNILIENANEIEKLGAGDTGLFKAENTENSPLITIDVSQLPSELLVLDATINDNTVYIGNAARALSRMNILAYCSFKGKINRLIGNSENNIYSQSLIALSCQFKEDNSNLILSINDLRVNQIINLRSGIIRGNVKNLKNGLIEYNIGGFCVDETEGNINEIPSSVKNIILESKNNLKYSDSRVWSKDTVYFIMSKDNIFSTEESDLILKDASNCGMIGGFIKFRGSYSENSENYINILRSRNNGVDILP